ncbi:MAG: HRDC domain-containing protein [Chloroflexi bacterium]|nr:HRDC domain-containing protein [Chloroflexota bacterium]
MTAARAKNISQDSASQAYQLVTTPAELSGMLSILRQEPRISVDTESNSFYAYYERVCLIQFSIPEYNFVVDPLAFAADSAVQALHALAEIFANPVQEKLFHAAEYDIMCLKRDFGFEFANLFDSMLACRILGWPQCGLASLLETHFNIHLDKRLQRMNWGQRPLPQEALIYAYQDTYYLLDLQKVQLAELERLNRLEEAGDEFSRLCQTPAAHKIFDPDSFWRIKGGRDLEPGQRAILRELYITREEIAQTLDQPPVKIMSDESLLRLAQAQPEAHYDLQARHLLSPRQASRYGERILQAIRQGRQHPPPQYSNNHTRPPEEVMNLYETLRQWRRHRAAKRNVEPDVILSNAALWAIARQPPRTLAEIQTLDVMGPWKLRTYGPDLLQLLQHQQKPKA